MVDVREIRTCECQLASYCNKECQIQDWPKHKVLHELTIKQSREVVREERNDIAADDIAADLNNLSMSYINEVDPEVLFGA